MADVTDDGDRRKRIAIIVLSAAVVSLVAALLVVLLTDDDSERTTPTTSTSSSTTTAPTAPPTTAPPPPPAQPECSTAAILPALQLTDESVSSVDDFKCGNGWAGASYSNPDFTSAALLKADGDYWTVVDRAQYCNDPSIPADVHFYCTVS